MKFLIISQYAGSRKHGMVLRNYNWAKELVTQGHEVTIIGTSFSHSRNFQPVMTGNVTEEHIDGIRYVWLKGVHYNPENYVMRIVAMLQFTCQLAAFPFRDLGKMDVVVASSPQPFIIFPAYRLARLWKAKLVYDVRDLWPLTLKKLGNATSYNPFIWLMQRAENFACHKCDVLTSVPRHAESYFKKHGLADGKFISVPNGILSLDVVKEALPSEHTEAIQSIRNENGFVIGYAGAFGKANALHSLLDALKLASNNIHAVFIGRGPFEASLKQQAQENGLSERVHFLPALKPDQVPAFLEQIDVAYLGLTYSDLFQYGASPTKLNDYLLAAKPVLYAIGDPKNPIEESGAGICCEPENSHEIALALDKLSTLSRAEIADMGKKGRVWLADNHVVEKQMKGLIEKLGL